MRIGQFPTKLTKLKEYLRMIILLIIQESGN